MLDSIAVEQQFVFDRQHATQQLVRVLIGGSTLLLVLDRSKVPLPTNGSERDRLFQVVKRKISGDTRSEAGRAWGDAFLGLMQTCARLGVSFWDDLDRRFGVADTDTPYLPNLVSLRSAQAPDINLQFMRRWLHGSLKLKRTGWRLARLISPHVACALISSLACAASEKAVMADRAADMVGVNTHINYRGSIYDTRWADIIRPRLFELGVRHIRDNPGVSGDIKIRDRFLDLARNGVHTLLINRSEADRDYVKSLNTLAGIPVVEAVEPPNELDLTGPGWQRRLRTFMQTMYPAYHGDPATQGIAVLGPSFADTRNSPPSLASAFPGASGYLDYGNLHNYSGVFPESPLGGGWGISQAASLETYRLVSDTKPLWVTENGYKMSGSLLGHPAVTQRAAAKYLPRQFLSHLQKGISRYYIYQLIDDDEDFGLLNDDGTPRLQFTAVRNFIKLFDDRGGAFTTSSLDFRLKGDLTHIHQVLLQKRNGTFYLVLWQGVVSVTGASDASLRDVEPPARNLTLKLATKIRQARTYRPSFSMKALSSHQDADGFASLSLSVPTDILVLELTPSSAP